MQITYLKPITDENKEIVYCEDLKFILIKPPTKEWHQNGGIDNFNVIQLVRNARDRDDTGYIRKDRDVHETEILILMHLIDERECLKQEYKKNQAGLKPTRKKAITKEFEPEIRSALERQLAETSNLISITNTEIANQIDFIFE